MTSKEIYDQIAEQIKEQRKAEPGLPFYDIHAELLLGNSSDPEYKLIVNGNETREDGKFYDVSIRSIKDDDLIFLEFSETWKEANLEHTISLVMDKFNIMQSYSILSYGCCENSFYAIQKHQRYGTDEPYFSLYVVDKLPDNMDMSLGKITGFLHENKTEGYSVAGSLDQIMEEFRDFLKTNSLGKDHNISSKDNSLNAKIHGAASTAKNLKETKQNTISKNPNTR